MNKFYKLTERAEWYNWFPRFFWKHVLAFFDQRNPYIVGSRAYTKRNQTSMKV